MRKIWHKIRSWFLEKWHTRKYAKGFRTWLPNPLTATQISAVVSHSKETLIIAGAGSGKTTALLGRARYLIESKRAAPESILALAFNRTAMSEFQNRADLCGIPIKAATFHGFGYSLLNQNRRVGGVAFNEDQHLYTFFKKHIESDLKDNNDSAKKLLTYFSELLLPLRAQEQFKSLEEYVAYARAIPKALSGITVKSHGELIIANHLFRRGVEFQYEGIYKGEGKDDWHRPDFTVKVPNAENIYVEYFGINKDKETAPYINADNYNKEIEWKKQIHESNKTDLIELTYQDLLDHQLISKLDKGLDVLGVPRNWKTGEDILRAAEDVDYPTRFINLCKSFLAHVRAKAITSTQLSNIVTNLERNRAFLEIFIRYLQSYETELEDVGLPDFSQMINEGADLLNRNKVEFPFNHLLVDEFQDISIDRLRMIEAMKKFNPDLEVVYVGDDWQSINRYAGADISIMQSIGRRSITKKIIRLGETHRFPQSLADYSSQFIQKNPSQIKKNITSKNPSVEESTIYFHSDTDSDNSMNLEKVIKRIRDHSGAEESLLVIARYNSSLPSDSFIKERWSGPFDIRTVHRSKGSEADYVIVVDLKQDFRGFPSTIEDDPILEMIMPRNDQYEFAEERRLFYVAMTRARKECHLITPASQPSLFSVELKNDDIGVTYGKHDFLIQRCPVCSSGILTISNFDGGSHCSNSPHCEFRASKCQECNQRLQVKTMNPFTFTCKSHPHTEVVTCPGCHWGVLREIEGPHGIFLGCSNYGVIQCNGKTKSKKRVTIGWNKNYTQSQH